MLVLDFLPIVQLFFFYFAENRIAEEKLDFSDLFFGHLFVDRPSLSRFDEGFSLFHETCALLLATAIFFFLISISKQSVGF